MPNTYKTNDKNIQCEDCDLLIIKRGLHIDNESYSKLINCDDKWCFSKCVAPCA